MTDVSRMFAIIVLGSIAFIIAGALLPSALIEYYNGIQFAEFVNGNESLGRSNMSPIVATLFRIAPLGFALAILLILLAMAGLKLSGKF